MQTHNKWLEGNGPLFVLLPKSIFRQWRGVNSSDYDIACQNSDDSINLIVFCGVESFILGGGDSLTLLIEKSDKQNIIIIRWIGADDETELVQMAKSETAGRQLQSDIFLKNTTDEWVVADATLDLSIDGSNFHNAFIPAGEIRINTQYIKGNSLSYIVHTFWAGGLVESR